MDLRKDSPKDRSGTPSHSSPSATWIAAGVSLRVLEMGFAEFLQITPRQFIRWNRMNRARRALSASCSQAASVTMIAGALGVNELGRFAVEYKNLFGESPSVTLRRDSGPPLERITELLAGTG